MRRNPIKHLPTRNEYEGESITNDVEPDELAAMRLTRDLTLVETGVAGLAEFDLQRPILARPGTDDAEPLIRRVRVPPHRQDVQVPVPHPRHLQSSQFAYEIIPWGNKSQPFTSQSHSYAK